MVMEARGIHVRDDGMLGVIGHDRADPERGAYRGLRAVGGDHQPRMQTLAAVGLEPQGIGAGRDRGDARVPEADARLRGDPCTQRSPELAILDRMAQRCDALLLGGQDGRAEAAAFRHVDPPDRRRPGGDRRPCADALEDAAAAVGQRRRARVEARLCVRVGRDGLDHGDLEWQLRERRSQREADHAAARNRHVAGSRSGHHAAAIRRSISSGSVGIEAVSTSGPSAVTTTSSSMRTPMPHHSRRTSLLPCGM